jgi:hypothetical protein
MRFGFHISSPTYPSIQLRQTSSLKSNNPIIGNNTKQDFCRQQENAVAAKGNKKTSIETPQTQ